MSETVPLKRPRSTSNISEEPDEKLTSAQLYNASRWEIPVTSTRGVQPVSFPLMQYCQMIQQMQHQHQQQQMEFPMAMMRKEKEETSSASTTPATSRRQTMNTSSIGPRPIRVPPQSLFNPLQFGIIPHQQHLAPPVDESLKTPSPAAAATVTRPQSPPQHIYNVPSFQRADEEIYSKFVESVRKLAAKLSAEKSS